ncbi:TPA: hypothetical protein BOS_16889 [Bos taurus]|nr:TPA: hypothetical protein BOS_16889 [Bos taurus]
MASLCGDHSSIPSGLKTVSSPSHRGSRPCSCLGFHLGPGDGYIVTVPGFGPWEVHQGLGDPGTLTTRGVMGPKEAFHAGALGGAPLPLHLGARKAMSNLDVIFKIPLSRGGLILLLRFPQALNTEFRVHWRGGMSSTNRPEMGSRPCESLLQRLQVHQGCRCPLQRCQLQTGACRGHSPPASTRIKARTAAAADPQHPPKGVQGGKQKGGPLCWEQGVFRELD